MTGYTVRLFALLTLVVLMLLPQPAAAANWWCAAMPWFPGCTNMPQSAALVEVRDFGSNPGQLRMFEYVPTDLGAGRPLVVALHGCLQQAASYDDEPGWIKYADKYHFALLLPQQQASNQPLSCFNWYNALDNERDKGEALSIRQMMDKLIATAGLDGRKVYITGLSAGGAMTAVMLAAYPERFAGGAIIAGIPYKCAANETEATSVCGVSSDMKQLTPAAWGDLVRAASSYSGPRATVSLWQGARDGTVDPEDQLELMKQWTDVLGIDQQADLSDDIAGNEHAVYQDANGKAQVETVLISGMDHGTPVNPGNGEGECGTAAPYILSVGVCSSYYISKFWGLDLQ
jgi:poly(hydroxyalkanoate) depolymerase family esterase